MKLLATLIFQIFSNMIAILASNHFIPGFAFSGKFPELALASLIFTAINLFLKPILKLILTPFIIITFGLLLIVINAGALYFLDILSEPLKIQGIVPLLLATLLIGIVNFFINAGAKIKYRKE